MKKLITFTLLLLLTACSSTPSGGGTSPTPTPEDPTDKVIDSKGTILGLYIKKTADYILIQTSKGYKYAISRDGTTYYPLVNLGTKNDNTKIDPTTDTTYMIFDVDTSVVPTSNTDLFAQAYLYSGGGGVNSVLCSTGATSHIMNVYQFTKNGYFNPTVPAYAYDNQGAGGRDNEVIAKDCSGNNASGVNPYGDYSIYPPFTVNGQTL